MSFWERARRSAAAPVAALEEALADPGTAQRRLLAELIARHAETEFGRAHGFSRIADWEDWKARVPVRRPDEFRGWIDRMAAGEGNILTVDAPVAFEETGGTSAGAKLVPLTPPSLEAFRAAVLPWLADLARRRPAVASGSAYVSISPVTRQPRSTPSGVSVGLPDAAYLGEELGSAFVSQLAVGPEVAAIADVEDWRLATLRSLVERDDLTFVSVWSPTFLLDLVVALPRLAERLSSMLTAPARGRLVAALSAPGLSTREIWPRLDTISCWTDAASAPHARRLADLCPQAWIEPKGLLATESAITLAYRGGDRSPEGPGCLPALTSAVLEFVDDGGGVHLCDDLRPGSVYDVVLTTPGGLWRWAIGDRLACVGFDGAAPRLEFRGRSGLVGDLVGEKLDEAFAASVLSTLGVPAALVARPDGPVWELWLDDGTIDPIAAALRVDVALRVNPQWAYARDLGQLAPLVGLARPGFLAARAETRARAGHRLAVEKPSAILLDP